ncbi:FkbM family methyltransferase [Roseomonas sp. JC162]|uniref:FkbM family methyltransferase n=1 Tax=Neoroseomonas marina TaxID=1232220 RepID=A0A848E8K0_9PROT|nr:FkbM family methyltransferase [Neoroseomonas marina]NMJ40774.1 FkbM family methyltransferase [Neoroseomonas marina]
MDLIDLRRRGLSPTLRGRLTNPIRRILWRLESPYFAALLDEIGTLRAELRALPPSPPPPAPPGPDPDVDGLRKDMMAVAHRLASLEDGLAPPPPAEPPRPSYAQCGEDRIIAYLLRITGAPAAIRYIDLGAAVPDGDNNTYLAYRDGGSGVLVEADPAYLPAYAALRPRDAVEAVAVVPAARRPAGDTVEVLLAENPGWTSVLPERIEEAARRGKGGLRARITVPAATIGEILDRHFDGQDLHLMSLDLEGIDEEVLHEVDFARHRPWVIVIETMGAPGPETFLAGQGYALYADTHVNRIFVRRDVLARATH